MNLPMRLAAYDGKSVYGVIWTTTPWTLVANQAVAYSPNVEYCLAESDDKNLYIVAVDLLQSNIEKIGLLKIITTFRGKIFTLDKRFK